MKLLITALAITLLASCATVFSGTTQLLTFDSSPQGADVYVDNMLLGTTPFEFEAKKNKYRSFRIEKDGYKTIQRVITKSFDPVTLLSVFWDYSTTDAISGAMYEYDQGSFYVELQPD